MSTKHTPGPWRRIKYRDGKTGVKVIAGEKKQYGIELICEAAEIYMDRGQREANATLISAAPEMLAELEMCAAIFRVHGFSEDAKRIQSLINKATQP